MAIGLQDHVFWYPDKISYAPALTRDTSADVVIVGGGMAGLAAAQAFSNRGCKVVLLERDFCGSGASGKSSGFITPNSELSLESLVRSHGAEHAKRLWEFVSSGVELIRQNIQNYQLACDYDVQDTLMVANTGRAFTSMLEPEHAARQHLGYTSTLYKNDVSDIIGSESYAGALRYAGSFGIQAYRYCEGVKDVLQQQGVRIYEQTPVTGIQGHVVHTAQATVQAQHIVVCADYNATVLNLLRDNVYHVQTFLMISQPLSEEQVKQIFPGQKCMVWDTDIIYHYYRLTGDNRLMLGGASLWDTYARAEKHHNIRMAKKLMRYITHKFPGVALTFEYIWPGLIGVSKDLLPLAGYSDSVPSVYCIAAATGLPWAAALGASTAERILDGAMSVQGDFSPHRKFLLGGPVQRVLGTPLTFALSNFLTTQSF